ncbi:type I secretion system permease/ATPase [Azospirillum sp. sgz301742]
MTVISRFFAALPPRGSVLRKVLFELAAGFGFAAVVTVFLNIALLTVPLYDSVLYDRVLLSRNMDTLSALSVLCVLGMVLYGALYFLRSGLFLALGHRMAHRMNVPVLQAAMLRSLDGEPSAAAQALRDINDLRLFVTGSTVTVPLDLLWSPALVTVLFLLHPVFGFYAVGCATMLFIMGWATEATTRGRFGKASAEVGKSFNDLTATLRKGELIDGLGMLPGLARRWQRSQNAGQAVLDAASRNVVMITAASRAFRLLMQGSTIALGVLLVIRHEASPGSLLGANLLVGKLLLPFEQLVVSWRKWALHGAALGRVIDLLGREDCRRGTESRLCQAGRLVVEDVGYAPAGRERAVLEGVSFTVEPGEAVAVVGPSASGKSSLARLLVGVIPPNRGRIELDGHCTWDWERQDFGRHVGYVPQAVSLLDGTVFENIARMGDAEPAAVVEAAQRAGVHEMIGRLPKGYDTWIGADGYTLSGGQRQRVALARALFGRPKLLVLDEPNSNLDHAGEARLAETIRTLKEEGVAVVVVTHRPALLEVADKVLVLKDGRVERFGSREIAPLRTADTPAPLRLASITP